MKCIALLLTLLLTSTSHGSIINLGEGVLLDTATGLEWLELHKSKGKSLNYVTNQFGAGGIYDGWTHANPNQITTFFNGIGAIPPYDMSRAIGDLSAEKILAVWGDTTEPPWGSDKYAYFVTAIPQESEVEVEVEVEVELYRLGLVLDRSGDLLNNTISLNYSGLFSNEPASNVAHALVRVATIPLPASMYLFITALGAITLIHKLPFIKSNSATKLLR